MVPKQAHLEHRLQGAAWTRVDDRVDFRQRLYKIMNWRKCHGFPDCRLIFYLRSTPRSRPPISFGTRYKGDPRPEVPPFPLDIDRSSASHAVVTGCRLKINSVAHFIRYVQMRPCCDTRLTVMRDFSRCFQSSLYMEGTRNRVVAGRKSGFSSKA